jgi:hypothetical protein
VITVLEQDTGGLDGWWLCAVRGKQGIAPGNRLKLLSGMLDANSSIPRPPSSDLYQSPSSTVRDDATHLMNTVSFATRRTN